VIVLELNVKSAKSQNAVVPDVVGVTLVNAAPAAVYPVPDTSFDVVYAVVLAFNVAELVYKASLKLFPELAVKLCVPTRISCLNDVHSADVILM
tara:strand:+ start:184 stop:465 length:282 start_codon:yes stop_codon:yes gene_type:complete